MQLTVAMHRFVSRPNKVQRVMPLARNEIADGVSIKTVPAQLCDAKAISDLCQRSGVGRPGVSGLCGHPIQRHKFVTDAKVAKHHVDVSGCVTAIYSSEEAGRLVDHGSKDFWVARDIKHQRHLLVASRAEADKRKRAGALLQRQQQSRHQEIVLQRRLLVALVGPCPARFACSVLKDKLSSERRWNDVFLRQQLRRHLRAAVDAPADAVIGMGRHVGGWLFAHRRVFSYADFAGVARR